MPICSNSDAGCTTFAVHVSICVSVSPSELSRVLGQPFIVENDAGAGGAIAAATTARARPDGYTLMIGYVATHGTNAAIKKTLYDALRDFTPIAMLGGTPNILVVARAVRPSTTVRTEIVSPCSATFW